MKFPVFSLCASNISNFYVFSLTGNIGAIFHVQWGLFNGEAVLHLKVLQSIHSCATWCIMVNASMWCLPTTIHKDWCARYYYRNDKESHTSYISMAKILNFTT